MKARKTPRITLYSTHSCSHCRQLRAWLKQQGLAFREFDIQRNARAFKEFQRHGGRSVPLLVAGDQTIRGFDAKRLPAQLRKAGIPL
ncbi:glutaredoxin family protein [Thiolapillus brandeum]|uniref:Glutaredoxin n=1 Tax=Thiolapillus brandeum TaxID=1076588 RepID=A0A7U6GL22_9GAMM|nr:glutaredoxin family protein [Thiolapillus brandeum]BAO45479.1 glutaredoxin [Thiolapillus brandeum]